MHLCCKLIHPPPHFHPHTRVALVFVSLALFLGGWTQLTLQGMTWKEVRWDTSLSTLGYSFKH